VGEADQVSMMNSAWPNSTGVPSRLPSHPKDWNLTWFYCKDTSPVDENPLPGYRSFRLNTHIKLPDRLTTAERVKYAPTF
jgi:hypothetical protein